MKKPRLNLPVLYMDDATPRSAIVSHVHSDTCVNLAVFGSDGGCYGRVSVRLGTEPGQWQYDSRELDEIGGRVDAGLDALSSSVAALADTLELRLKVFEATHAARLEALERKAAPAAPPVATLVVPTPSTTAPPVPDPIVSGILVPFDPVGTTDATEAPAPPAE